MSLNGMNKDDLSRMMDEKEEELRRILSNNEIVETEILDISKKIADLKARKAALDIAQKQGSYNKQRVQSELREIKNRYFRPE